jgi:hypothetical protein
MKAYKKLLNNPDATPSQKSAAKKVAIKAAKKASASAKKAVI